MPGKPPSRSPLCAIACLLASFSFLTSCGHVPDEAPPPKGKDNRNKMIVSIRDQEMLLVADGIPIRSYKISTSKFGLGDKPGSNRTPLGHMQVATKIGDRAPLGSVFKSRRRTGEILKPNAPGRDPIVTRILWLKGTEARNRNAYGRAIYIHGTPEERNLGKPASYGCIRMSSRDVADLFRRVHLGADVFVIPGSITPPESESHAAFLAQVAEEHGS